MCVCVVLVVVVVVVLDSSIFGSALFGKVVDSTAADPLVSEDSFKSIFLALCAGWHRGRCIAAARFWGSLATWVGSKQSEHAKVGRSAAHSDSFASSFGPYTIAPHCQKATRRRDLDVGGFGAFVG